ncbi:hypothetical protein SAE02_69920 [Skermanella aerolata]|uniref:Uncharacterized protein n=1 Tax=Skermanella aerolata TaxID=393310 RepID=A0A512E2A7_9PROT|nr:hypothetical protein [Skermanella aerolata]KJB91262.1 hypothetical protein N826_31540 [Skermanella aerolata KACC 11604]GEO42844.1 hypothetical protein SAE02_69920 [Skermanella aerolata]
MKIKAFDAVVLRKLQPEIEAALAALGRRHGITIRAGTARFRESTAELKLELAVIGGDGKSARREVEEFAKYHAMYGLEAGDLGRVVILDHEEHCLVGLAPNRPKYPIVMERLRDGKVVLCTEDVIEKITALRLLKPS